LSAPFFTPAINPPFAAHWSDIEPRVWSEIKNRASALLSSYAEAGIKNLHCLKGVMGVRVVTDMTFCLCKFLGFPK